MFLTFYFRVREIHMYIYIYIYYICLNICSYIQKITSNPITTYKIIIYSSKHTQQIRNPFQKYNFPKPILTKNWTSVRIIVLCFFFMAMLETICLTVSICLVCKLHPDITNLCF